MADTQNEVVKSKKQLYDEARAEKLKQREKEQAKELKKQKKDELDKKYRNPVFSTPGKILIWILAISMVAVIVISLIYLIITKIK